MLSLKIWTFFFEVIFWLSLAYNLFDSCLAGILSESEKATIARANIKVYEANIEVERLRARATAVENAEIVVENLLNEIKDLDPEIVRELIRLSVIATVLPDKISVLEQILNYATVVTTIPTTPKAVTPTTDTVSLYQELQQHLPDDATINTAASDVLEAKCQVRAFRSRATVIESAESDVSNLSGYLTYIEMEPNILIEYNISGLTNDLHIKLAVLEQVLNDTIFSSNPCIAITTRVSTTLPPNSFNL